jgi:4-hydroxybenzoate polyprenyltransferase
MSFPLENPYLVIHRPIKLSPIFLDGYLVYLSNATGLDAKRVLFLAQLFLQNTTISEFREF